MDADSAMWLLSQKARHIISFGTEGCYLLHLLLQFICITTYFKNDTYFVIPWSLKAESVLALLVGYATHI